MLEAPDRVELGAPIQVGFVASEELPSGAFVALYAEGKTGKDYYTYSYLPSVASEGTVELSAPNAIGRYSVRLVPFTNRSYHPVASAAVAVGPTYDLTATSNGVGTAIEVGFDQTFGGDYSGSAWVGMYPAAVVGSDREQPVAHKSYLSYQVGGFFPCACVCVCVCVCVCSRARVVCLRRDHACVWRNSAPVDSIA